MKPGTRRFRPGACCGFCCIDTTFAIQLNCAHLYSVLKATVGKTHGSSGSTSQDRAWPTSASVLPKLLDRVRDAIRARHYSIRTEEAYVAWVRRFILFHNKRHPAEMGESEISQFLTHLAVRENVAASTQNQALAAILFLYQDVLEAHLEHVEGVVRAKQPRRLPQVLTRDDVRACLNSMSGTPKVIAMLLYGAGLRLLEALHLGVRNIDFTMTQITVRDGKGQKDRITMLPGSARALLADHLLQVRIDLKISPGPDERLVVLPLMPIQDGDLHQNAGRSRITSERLLLATQPIVEPSERFL